MLPISERISLAQTLWQSIESGLPDADPNDSLRKAIQRDQELSSGAVAGRTHEEVMAVARRALRRDLLRVDPPSLQHPFEWAIPE